MNDPAPGPGAASSGPPGPEPAPPRTAVAHSSGRLMALIAVRTAFFLAVAGAILFLAAGTVDWPFAWAYLGAYLASIVVFGWLVAWRNPDLIAERMQAERKADVKRWDRPFVAAIAIVLPPAVWLVAGLDRRFGWSSDPGIGLAVVALAVAFLGSALSFWAMASNRFFSALVRIQKDRGHVVVTGGPYAAVRHPGYVGAIATNLATPVVLGSVWALAIGAVIVVLFVVRTALEDRTLQRELDGYADYARRVRWRLLPGVW